MMKTLNLTYKGSLGKTHTLKLNYAKEGLDEKAVRQSMQTLASAKAFKKDNEELFVVPVPSTSRPPKKPSLMTAIKPPRSN